MYICFEGVRDVERILSMLFRLTLDDIDYAPGLLGVKLSDGSRPDTILGDPGLQELEDTPEGFWVFDLVDDEYFLDRVEEAFRSNRGNRCRKRRK